jgi:hypothetical protein
MTVRMRHPDLEGQEIVVASSAAPLHALSGWVAVEGQDDMGEELPAELQPFEGQPTFLMRHPDVEGDPVVAAESQVPFYRERGWVLVTDEDEPEEGLEVLTVPELRELAKTSGITPIPTTKAELIAALSQQPSQQQAGGDAGTEQEQEG